MNPLTKIARGERVTIIAIAFIAAIALVLAVGGFFMVRTFLTNMESGTAASKASADSHGGMSGETSSGEASQAPYTESQPEAAAPTLSLIHI